MAGQTRTRVDPETALRLFRLKTSASLWDLNGAYRRIVRKYHPDYNPNRTEWAHEAMVKINAAYDAALEYLSSLRYEEIERHLEVEIRAHDRFTEVLSEIGNNVLEGIFIYYQYGLENPFARQHGVPRFRYRVALKKVSSGIDQLQRLGSPNETDAQTLDILCTFSIAFLQCMRMSRAQDPSGRHEETLAYKHYRAGSENLDLALQKILFGDQLQNHKRRAAPHQVSVAHDEFMAVLTEHPSTSWVSDAAVKLFLIDTIVKLQAIAQLVPDLGIAP